jgi:acetyl-CoA C-acetyltransferase
MTLNHHLPVIVAAKRTPIGCFQGNLSSFKGYQLGSAVIKSLEIPHPIDEVIMGCVLPASQGQAPTRQAAIQAGLKDSTACSTINKVCGSGMKAVFIACDQIRLKQANLVVAGGMESMSNTPYLLDRARSGYRIGHGIIIDHLYRDGLEDPFHNNADGSRVLMGEFAEETASAYNFERTQQEQFVVESLEHYQKAYAKGFFDFEIAPLEVKDAKGNIINVAQDEQPARVKPEKFSVLKPAFRAGGTVTAATSSPLSDGAAALAITSEGFTKEKGLFPLAKVVGYCSHSQQPAYFTTAPIQAIKKLCQQIGWALNDIDLFEINEAFAIVPMAVMHDLDIPRNKINIHGGACVLGHPIAVC